MAPLSLKVVLAEGAVSKTVLFESGMRVAQAQAIVKEKVLTADDGKEYGLFLTSADDEGSGVWLEGDRNLEYYMLRDGDQLHYLCRIRNLRIRMLDGSVKTLQVDESKTVAELMVGICARIGITNHDEYGLCREDEEVEEKPAAGAGTLTRRAAPARERDHKLDQLSKKLKTDDNVEWLEQHRTLREQRVPARAPLLLRRRLFYTDRNVDARDPVGLTLLYVQTRNDILEGRHPVTEPQGEATLPLRGRLVVAAGPPRLARQCPPRRARRRPRHVAMPLPFNKSLNLKLIALVKENPPLYNTAHPKFMDHDAREVIWQKIGDALNRPGSVCKARWINIRDMMRRKYRERLSFPNQRVYTYKYEEELAFIKPFYKDMDLVSDGYNEFIDNADCSVNMSEEVLLPVEYDEKEMEDYKKHEDSITERAESVPQELNPTDPLDVFLITIGSTLRKFTPYYLNQAKSKIFQVVQDYELQQIVKDEEGAVKIKCDNNR